MLWSLNLSVREVCSTLRLQTTVIYASLIHVIFSLCNTFYCSQGKEEEEAKENHLKICIFLLAAGFPDNY